MTVVEDALRLTLVPDPGVDDLVRVVVDLAHLVDDLRRELDYADTALGDLETVGNERYAYTEQLEERIADLERTHDEQHAI